MRRSTLFSHHLNSMVSLGYAAEDVLRDTHLRADKLDQLDYLIDPWQGSKFITNMIQLTGNEALAFELAKKFHLTDYGIVGYAVMSCKSVREAARLWIKYGQELTGSLVEVKLVDEKQHWGYALNGLYPSQQASVFAIEEVLLHILNFGQKLAEKTFDCKALHLAYPEPAHSHLYESLFQCPIHFSAAETQLLFSAPALDTAVTSNNEELYTICLQHCDQILREISQKSPLAAKIRTYLLQNTGQVPSLNEMAAHMNLSASTLKRRLQDQGLSYQTLVNEFRNDLAKEYISHSPMSAKEIGYVLGYEDSSAFRRAFKAWNGMTISDYKTSLSTRS